MVSNKITVLPVIIASDMTKRVGDSDTFKAKFVDGQGNPIVGKKVTFNINGVMYTRLSDSNGVAELDINLGAGEYIIVTSMYNQATTGNKITVMD